MLGLFGFVLAIHGVGFYRRMMIAWGAWREGGETTSSARSMRCHSSLTIWAFVREQRSRSSVSPSESPRSTFSVFLHVQVGIRSDHRISREGPYRWIRHPPMRAR